MRQNYPLTLFCCSQSPLLLHITVRARELGDMLWSVNPSQPISALLASETTFRVTAFLLCLNDLKLPRRTDGLCVSQQISVAPEGLTLVGHAWSRR